MSATSLRCYVDRTAPWPTVRVAGELDVAGAAVLRQTVLKCLADEPAAVVLDLRGLTSSDDAALTSLATLGRAAAAWPAIPLVAHSVTVALAARMQALSVTRSVLIVADAGAAAAALAEARGPGAMRIEFSSSHDLVMIRAAARRACQRAGGTDIADTLEVVVTELATNALCHAAGPRFVLISASSNHAHIAVRDRSGGAPEVRDADQDEHGRGLRIVEALSAAWGTTPTRDGKVVWATVRPERHDHLGGTA